MRLLIIDEDYPSPTNLYGDVFAHVRVKAYKNYFEDVLVVAALKDKERYTYEGVDVICPGSVKGMHDQIVAYNPDIILIHFATHPIITGIIEKINKPYVIWVHGYEALAWYRRLFNYKKLVDFLYYVKGNMIQLYHYRRLIKKANKSNHIHFVFVSNWMKKIAQFDCAVRVKNYHIIPNPIDNRLFYPVTKDPSLRKRILLIRPFYSKKYATDIVTDAMVELSNMDFFEDLHFTVYGKGSTSSRMFRLFGSRKNVSIKEGFLTQQQIKQLHDEHGIFMALTRQDAQGVSMCEAMSSGLVILTSNNTAIPEFVTHRESGFVTNNDPKQVAAVIKELYENPQLFMEISKKGSEAIIDKAGVEEVTQKEVQLIRSLGKTEKAIV